ncbi:MAG: S8 family serine peptidase, partial [Ignavibacteriaceae bacterium]|nr:S8 family serine peptidase [Ignavibacteriaceae bacterium]
MLKKVLILFALITFGFEAYSQGEFTTRFERILQNIEEDSYIKGIIFLKDQADIETLNARLYAEKATPERRAFEVITTLQNKANATQPALISYIQDQYLARNVFSYKSFWIANMITVEARASVFRDLVKSNLVSIIDFDAPTELDKYEVERTPVEGKESVEPGIRIINAHLLWELGITGQGQLVMGEDTGVRHTHSAINARWRGNFAPANQAWLDPAGGTTTPSDCDGHGTHTVGTMVGRSAAGDTIGVAPDAQWMAAKTICSGNSTSNHYAAFQWAMDPDGNPNTTTDMPIAINCSWHDPTTTNQCNGQYLTVFQNVEAAGIAVIFSAGNAGPNPSTITMPKNINTNLVNIMSVANIDGAQWLNGNNNPISSSSSRGPSACGGTGSLLIKPEVSAPGTNVRSSVASSDNAYANYSGTSMAAPHVAGAIALLKQANPLLTGYELKMALYETARDLGAAGEDNNYGMGLIDVYAAYLLVATGPGSATNVIPANAATGVALNNNPTISWTNPDSAISNTVYFSYNQQSVNTLNPSAIVKAGGLFTSYAHPSTLEYSKTYYWRVVERASSDSSLGPVFSFSTLLAPAPVPPSNINAVWVEANNTVAVTWTTPTVNIYNQPITVDSSSVWSGNSWLGSVVGTGASKILSNVPNGFHTFSVVSYVDGYASVRGFGPTIGVGIYGYVYERTGMWKNIRDNQNTLDTIIVPSSPALIAKVLVRLDTIIHTFTGDLDIYIKAPNGTEVELSTDNGSSGDNYIMTVFDDDAATSITSGTAPFTGSFRPEQPLTVLNGTPASGAWILRVFDDASADTGHLKSWTLTIITTSPVPVELTSFSAIPSGNDVLLEWTTATELNNAGFEVERKSSNSSVFEKIGFVTGKGTTTETVKYRFDDRNVPAGVHTYRLKQVDFDGTYEYSNEIESESIVPQVFYISQNYPNPFNPMTNIVFGLPVNSIVTVSVYDALGQLVNTLVNGTLESGVHTLSFDAGKLNSGI